MWSFLSRVGSRGPLPDGRGSEERGSAGCWRIVPLILLAAVGSHAASVSFRTGQLPWAVIGTPYRFTLVTSVDQRCLDGGSSITTIAGSLPSGVELRGDTLSGVPEELGAFPLRLRISNTCASEDRDFVLQVTGKPILRVTPEEVAFEYRAGGPLPDPKSLKVSASWSNLPYTISRPVPAWLQLRPRTGATPLAGSPYAGDLVEMRINPQDLAPGVYESALTLSVDGGANQVVVPVRLRIQPAN